MMDVVCFVKNRFVLATAQCTEAFHSLAFLSHRRLVWLHICFIWRQKFRFAALWENAGRAGNIVKQASILPAFVSVWGLCWFRFIGFRLILFDHFWAWPDKYISCYRLSGIPIAIFNGIGNGVGNINICRGAP